MEHWSVPSISVACWILFCMLQFRNLVVRGTDGPNCEEAIGCECVDLLQVSGVLCDNVTDFGQMTQKLGDGSLYEVNETYEITLTGIRALPARFLEGLIVFRLYVDDPLMSNISEHAFEGVMRLRRLHIRASSVTVLPNFTSVSHSLRNLNFDNSLLAAVNDEIQNLPLLTELTLRRNVISSVAPNAFMGTSILDVLDLSGNLLESLPLGLLDSLYKLRKFVLSRNRFHTVEGLFKIVRPRFILLDHNNLTDADSILYDNMTSVETLQLSYNPLGKVSSCSFNGKIPKARFINLDYCEIKEFDVEHYYNLSILALLDLTGNYIETIPNKTIDFGENLQLLLENNRISSFHAEITYKVKRFFLSGNEMRLLGSTLHLTQLSEVEVNDNLLEALIDTDLRGVHRTENLLFRGNLIRRIDTEVFVSVRNDLKYLDLSINLIQSLNGSVRFLSQLKSLNVSRNALTAFQEGEFVGLNELSELFMQNNQILALGGQIQRIPQLQYLTLQCNRITTLRVEQLPKSLKYLYFKENSFACNCQLLPFLEWLDRPSAPETDISYCRASDASKSPLLPSHEGCPQSCTCYCTKDVNDSYVEIDCRARGLSRIPHIFLNERNNTITTSASLLAWHPTIIRQNKDSKFLITDRVLSVNLENNSVESLDKWHFPFDLKELKLANNDLSTLPDAILELPGLRRLTLSGNPWACDCDAVEFKKWLSNKGTGVLDVNRTRCGSNFEQSEMTDKLLVSLSDVDLCPSYVALYITVTFSLLSLLLFVLALKVVYTCYEMNIKVWLYAHGISWVKEDDLDKDKVFDAFISFSHQDEEFVSENIVAEVEERVPDIRLCLHYRNFLPGEFIHNNIMNAVKNSKRTVLVVSKNFLESEWCLLEFRAAHLQAMEDKVFRIIVIKVGELPEDIDPAIKVYLKSTTYVTWGEKYFWQKLLYALPEPTKYYSNDTSTTKLVPLTT